MNSNIKRVTLAPELSDPYYLKDPKLLEFYQKSLPPKEAYLYFPKGEEIIIYNTKKPQKNLRRVYYNTPYTPQETQWLNDFKTLLKNHPETQLPDFFGDYLLLAFIYATECKLEESYKRLLQYLKFSNETFPIVISPTSKLIEILNKGFMYVYGRDNRFRPIVIIECKIFEKFYKDYQCDEIIQASYLLCQYLVNNMLIPGQFESWNMIINLKGVSILSLPEPVKKMIPALSSYFLGRLYKNYMLGLSFITRIIFKIACHFLDPVTVQKVNVVEGDDDPKMFTSIRRDNIEQKFMGTAPNLPIDSENGFFPPRMPSEHFIKDDENKANILISEEEYINRYKKGEIPQGCVSPYLYEKILEEEKKIKEEKEKEKMKEEIKEQTNQTKTTHDITNQISNPSLESQKQFLYRVKTRKDDLKRKKMNYIEPFLKFNSECIEDSFIDRSKDSKFDDLIGNKILFDINKFNERRNNFISKLPLVKS